MTSASALKWTLGDRLAKARRHNGWSQAEMAALLGISRRSISRYEDDHGTPSRAVLIAWSQLTGAPLEWLSGDDGGTSAMGPATRRYPARRFAFSQARPLGGWHPAASAAA